MPSFNPSPSFEPSTICIPQSDYDSLINIASKYVNLSRNLLRGGVDEDTIALLSSNDSRTSHEPLVSRGSDPPAYSGPIPPRTPSRVVDQPRKAGSPQQPQHYGTFNINSPSPQKGPKKGPKHLGISGPYADPLSGPTSSSIGSLNENVSDTLEPAKSDHSSATRQIERVAQRSVTLLDLPESTTHADITKVVRGGQILDIYLRKREHYCNIAFVYADDAKAFYDYAMKHGFYIKGTMIKVEWADRQYTVVGHVAHKIDLGATRNLVIRGCDPNLTDDAICDDLEHIHNLVVVKVEFVRGDCIIETNSVNNAMFARTCMMSRFKYKGVRIEWSPDECAEPLPQKLVSKQYSAPPPRVASTKSPLNPLANRFRLLDLDDDIDDDDDDDDDDDSKHCLPY